MIIQYMLNDVIEGGRRDGRGRDGVGIISRRYN
jgi:hypothetical protein